MRVNGVSIMAITGHTIKIQRRYDNKIDENRVFKPNK